MGQKLCLSMTMKIKIKKDKHCNGIIASYEETLNGVQHGIRKQFDFYGNTTLSFYSYFGVWKSLSLAFYGNKNIDTIKTWNDVLNGPVIEFIYGK